MEWVNLPLILSSRVFDICLHIFPLCRSIHLKVVAGSLACLERLGRVRLSSVTDHAPLLWKALRLCIGSYTTTDSTARIAPVVMETPKDFTPSSLGMSPPIRGDSMEEELLACCMCTRNFPFVWYIRRAPVGADEVFQTTKPFPGFNWIGTHQMSTDQCSR